KKNNQHLIDFLQPYIQACGQIIRSHRTDQRRQQVENELRESEARFRRIFDSIQDAFFQARLSGEITLVNPQAARMLGYKHPGELIGRDIVKTMYANPEQREKLKRELLRHDRVNNYELQLRHRDGHTIVGEAHAHLVFDEHNQPFAIEAIVRDITVRKKREAELESARLLAEKANRARNSFLNEMSQEFRNPLNTIMGLVQILRESRLNSEQRITVNALNHSAEILLTLINDILDFARIESGILELQKGPFDLEDLLNDVWNITVPPAEEKRLEVICKIDRDTPTSLIGDSNRLRQILIHLFSNAVKFTDLGEVILSIKEIKKNPDAMFRERLENEYDPVHDRVMLQFQVQDTGVGLLADQVQSIFSPTEQEDENRARSRSSGGLGLAICRRLVHAMDGDMRAESVEGKGALITVIIPLERPVSVLHEAWRDIELNDVRILVVEKHPLTQKLIEETLKAHGARVEIAAECSHALRLVENSVFTGDEFVIKLIEQHPEGMELFAFLNELRTHGGFPNSILMSAYPIWTMNFSQQLQDMGIRNVLSRPIRRLQMLQTIQAMAGRADTNPDNIRRRSPFQPGMAQRKLKLLVAEDNSGNRTMLQSVFNHTSFEVEWVVNGIEALDKFENNRYDVVLMDLQMPVMDGLTAVRRMRKWEQVHNRRRTPIIAMTAYAFEEDRVRSLHAGCDATVSKPVRINTLISAIGEAL
ncbi:MAG: response regulator, partial [Leptospiraceae bacterium]|nr:response regulator [Leptospiraceae bacterium]